MSSLHAEVITAIQGAGIEQVHRDFVRHPVAVDAVYAVVFVDPARSPALEGDSGVLWWSRSVIVEVWQPLATEDETLVDTVAAALRTRTADGRRLRVPSINRAVDPDAGTVQVVLNVTVHEPA
jgi:hypothetical protein